MSLRQPIKWHGGKYYLAPWIIGHMPPRDSWHLYREPYAGGLSVLLRLDPEGLSEAVNDKEIFLTNFWSVLSQPELFELFRRRCEATPLSEILFNATKLAQEIKYTGDGTPEENRINAAYSFFVLARQSRQGLMKDFATPTVRLRRGMNKNVSAWLSAVEGLPDIHSRMKRVEIRCMDAIEFIKRYDHEQALFYCDPPYLHETRHGNGENSEYKHEMTEADHCSLLECLSHIKGRFLLSGYKSGVYDEWERANRWRRVEKEIDNKASLKKAKETKTECLWMNY